MKRLIQKAARNGASGVAVIIAAAQVIAK